MMENKINMVISLCITKIVLFHPHPTFCNEDIDSHSFF